MKDLVKSACKEIGINLTDLQAEQFEKYYNLLIEWNKSINLTRITEPEEVAVKHFADSLSVINYFDIPDKAKLIDVGTGAGFPGIPLKIFREDIELYLLDSLNKRLNFLGEVSEKIGIDSQLIHARAEEAGKDNTYREEYDVAVSRAVARMNVLCEYCIPFVKVGGYFVAMKGADYKEEIEEADNAVKVLGGEIIDVKKFSLNGAGERAVIVIKKIKPTPEKYPRTGKKIKNRHL